MGGRQIRPSKVWRTKMDELTNPVLREGRWRNINEERPPWLDIINSCPPSESLVRTLPPQLKNQKNPKRGAKPRNLYRPQLIEFPEDKLRKTFYKDHPWELARPRVIVEADGKDYQLVDWSKGLRQPGMPLSGECVVQRQLWRIQNEEMSVEKAYDITRREFYRLRQEEEIEKRLAKEEAKYVGAYFGMNRSQVGMILEDAEFENWKVWAGKEAKKRELGSGESSAAAEEVEIEDTAAEVAEQQPVAQTQAA